MKNLYRRLSVSDDASGDAIRQALVNVRDPSLREDAQTILLDPRMRRVYDAAHRTALDVAEVRSLLGFLASPQNPDLPGVDYDLPPRKSADSGRSVQVNDNSHVFPSVLIALGVFLVLCLIYTSTNKTSRPETPAEIHRLRIEDLPPPPQAMKRQFQAPAANFPGHGMVERYTSDLGLAPLMVHTSPGENYYIKLVNSTTNTNVLGVWAIGGRTVDILVPLGTYQLRYASGQIWYGTEHLFGPNTSCAKAETLLTFSATNDGYAGHTVTLIKKSGGNLTTSAVDQTVF